MDENRKILFLVLLKIGIIFIIMGLFLAIYSYNQNKDINKGDQISNSSINK